MAAHERLHSHPSIASSTLLQKLASVLPKGVSFRIYHLSTPPSRTSAIYSAPSGSRPDRTYCESHFLAVSIRTPAKDDTELKEVLVYAVEILIYSTAYNTTFFVSKADSSGYLKLLTLAEGTPSPLRSITATFLQHLVEGHQREHLRSIISLFARAADAYLFPGSENSGKKNRLDDRGLVKWWCRVLDPLIEHSREIAQSNLQWDTVKGYLIVPGLDSYETNSFIPKRSTPDKSWTVGHPLLELSRHTEGVAPRCLIPRFPDDPKARYLDELDEEISRGRGNSADAWKSIKTVEQFWDTMAFRSECSAGRMVGFIWIIFTPKSPATTVTSSIRNGQSTVMSIRGQVSEPDHSEPVPSTNFSIPITPTTSFNISSQICQPSSPIRDIELPSASQQSTISSKHASTPKRRKKKKLSGPIVPRQPRVKTENKNYLLDRPEMTAYYIWRPECRGQIIVDENDYKRTTGLLLHLQFDDLEKAVSSSTRWVNEVRSGAWGSMRDAWGQEIIGTKVVEVRSQVSVAGVQTLNLGLVRKKRKPGAEEPKVAPVEPSQQVNVIPAMIVRKKPKV